MLMKKAVKIICPVIFLIICILVIQFLHLFTEAKSEITYLNFSESVQILENGTEIPFSTDTYSNEGALSAHTDLQEKYQTDWTAEALFLKYPQWTAFFT